MFVYAIIVSVLTVQQMLPRKREGKLHFDLTPIFYIPILGRVLGLW